MLILGAGFGGLELATLLSEELGGEASVTMIDRSDAFVFGYSKLDVMFGRQSGRSVRLPYREIAKPGVRVLQETVTAIDPQARRVTTDAGMHDADVLVVALGADLDVDATPGLRDAGNEFYSVEGAERLAPILAAFGGGPVVIGGCGFPFKCPPAPSEAALLLHDHLVAAGVRDRSSITVVLPVPRPVPPSPPASDALLAEFAARDIVFVPDRRVVELDGARSAARLDDGAELPYALFLGIPLHRAPRVVRDGGLADDGYVPVDPATLETRFPDVYAIGDVAAQGTPKAGVFAEGAARAVASAIVARARGGEATPNAGVGACYVEFGEGRVGRVDVDAFAGTSPRGTLAGPTTEIAAEKARFGETRRRRWFDRPS